ncbi:MAG: hypothetical protein Q7K39_04095 [Candidatus Magasanikbacteria bacterium]|nr:hypothetical protein [Candidatus Magasanikbacteria bacterium]
MTESTAIPPRTKREIYRDLGLVLISILVAILFVKTPILLSVLSQTTEYYHALGSFIAGIFFTSIFTTAPATVALAEIAHANSLWLTALFGALGALLGDLFIFKFVRDNVTRDFEFIFNEIKKERRWLKIHHRWKELHAFKWVIPLIGALCIASPLPDEIGISILALSKMKTSTIGILTFILNFLGILLIGWIGKMVL